MLSHRVMEPGSGLIATKLLSSRVMKVTTWWEETLSVVSNPLGLGIGMECSRCAAVSQFVFRNIDLHKKIYKQLIYKQEGLKGGVR